MHQHDRTQNTLPKCADEKVVRCRSGRPRHCRGLVVSSSGECQEPASCRISSGATRIVRGHVEIRFLEKVFQNTPPLRQRYRTEYFTNGTLVTWEYPHETPQGEQMDFVEVMDVNDRGLIQHHRVYWGWRGVGIVQRGEYHP